MGCLFNTIGIHGCGADSPASGIFIDSFAGISLKSIDSLADQEQRDYVGVWNDVQLNAERRFMVDLQAKLGKHYRLNRATSSIDLGRTIDTTSTTTASAEYRGVIFDLTKRYGTGSNKKPSALQSHYIQDISIYLQANLNHVTVNIVDVVTNTTLQTITKNLSIGWNLISVDSEYNAEKLAVVLDCTAINSVSLNVDSTLGWSSTCSAAVEGFTYTIGQPATTGTRGDNSHGVSIVYGTRCSYENLVCKNKDLFYLPYAYLCAVELTVTRQFSPRISKWTLNQKEANELRLYFEQQYEQTLAQIADSITLDLSDACLECDGRVTIIENPLC